MITCSFYSWLFAEPMQNCGEILDALDLPTSPVGLRLRTEEVNDFFESSSLRFRDQSFPVQRPSARSTCTWPSPLNVGVVPPSS